MIANRQSRVASGADTSHCSPKKNRMSGSARKASSARKGMVMAVRYVVAFV